MASPFHEGEASVQERMGVRAIIEDMGRSFIRPFMPDQHRQVSWWCLCHVPPLVPTLTLSTARCTGLAQFYHEQPYVVVGSVDNAGQPWASILFGKAGFMDSPDPTTLRIRATPVPVDPLAASLAPVRRPSPTTFSTNSCLQLSGARCTLTHPASLLLSD